jgi:bifunctional DNA-binding transcriptional regulator/antitoxin component of YhaV-PrlF toxin-antitoxin module
MIFKSFVTYANKRGTGIIRIPKDIRDSFKEGELLRITVLSQNQTSFYVSIRKIGNLGFYIPKEIMRRIEFPKEHTFQFEKIDGFCSKIGSDGRVYIPASAAEKFNLENDSIILIESIIENQKFSSFCQVKTRIKRKRTEYKATFNKSLANKSGIFGVKRNLSKEKNNFFPNAGLLNIIAPFNYFSIDKDEIIMFYGNRVPVIIRADIKIEDLAYYLGAYFADGTKRGNNWGIVASTFEQANFYTRKHKSLIKNSFLIPELSFSSTDEVDTERLKKSLAKEWFGKTSIFLREEKIRIRHITASLNSKRNKYGSLIIKENRQLVLLFYVRVLDFLIKKIIEEKNKALAIDFILGCFEGDGNPGPESHPYIMLTTNKNDHVTLERISSISGLQFKPAFEKKTSKYYLRFSSLSVLTNLKILKGKIFKYYPKRRCKFVERFLNTGSAKFLMGKQNSIPGWIKAYFVKERILTKSYELTEKGRDIKEALSEMAKSVTVK